LLILDGHFKLKCSPWWSPISWPWSPVSQGGGFIVLFDFSEWPRQPLFSALKTPSAGSSELFLPISVQKTDPAFLQNEQQNSIKFLSFNVIFYNTVNLKCNSTWMEMCCYLPLFVVTIFICLNSKTEPILLSKIASLKNPKKFRGN
jgi:hypothetical protein